MMNVYAASAQQSFMTTRRRFSSPPLPRISPRLRSLMDGSVDDKADLESTRLSVDIPTGNEAAEQIDSAVDSEFHFIYLHFEFANCKTSVPVVRDENLTV
jgi:hypothetical protein